VTSNQTTARSPRRWSGNARTWRSALRRVPPSAGPAPQIALAARRATNAIGIKRADLIGFANGGSILGEAFFITAVTALALAAYAWTTKRDFSRLGDYLFFGVILLLVAGIIGIFFQTTLFQLIIAVVGIAIFSGYVLFYVQRAKYMADTLPNAIGLTVSLFITLLNLFLYILELLSILQGGDRRR